MDCSRGGCNADAAIRHAKRQWYCPRCSRITKWLSYSHRRYPPIAITWNELSIMLSEIESSMRCPLCERQMYIDSAQGRSHTVTIQHWDDGRITLCCFACNIRHKTSSFRDRVFDIPKNQKDCPSCGMVKLKKEFPQSRNRINGVTSRCNECVSRLRPRRKYHSEEATL